MKTHRTAFECSFFATGTVWFSGSKSDPRYSVLKSQASISARVLGIDLAPIWLITEDPRFDKVLSEGAREVCTLPVLVESRYDSKHGLCCSLGMHLGNLLGASALVTRLAGSPSILSPYWENVNATARDLGVPQGVMGVTQATASALDDLLKAAQRVAAWLESAHLSDHPSVFISYAEEEGEIATRIAEALAAAGIYTWRYKEDGRPGEPHIIQTGRVIDNSQVIVLLVSDSALASDFVAVEVFRGYEKKKGFLPVLIGMDHDTFVGRRPKWMAALGFATTIEWDGAAATLARVVEGVTALT